MQSVFPQNINIAATLSLAGIGAEKTSIKIMADPAVKRSIHKISVEGDFGKLSSEIECNPTEANPKSSIMAALSATSLLLRLSNGIRIVS